MFSLIENAKVVPVAFPKDFNSAAMTTEYINMKNYRRCTFILTLGTQTSTSNAAVKLVVADDASGTHKASVSSSSADMTFTEYYKAPTSSANDVYTKATVASSTFNITKSSDSKVFIIEADAEKMGQFVSTSVTYSADWLALSVATPGAHASLKSCIAILTDPRYASDSPPSAI